MFRNQLILEVKAGEERMYCFTCAPNSPKGECYDALCSMQAYLLQEMIEDGKKKSEEDSKEECKEGCEEDKPKDA